jgi:hypothetical protein
MAREKGTQPELDVPDMSEKDIEDGQAATSSGSDAGDSPQPDKPENQTEGKPWDWNEDPHNPYNWSSGKKAMQVVVIGSMAFLA